MIYLKRHKYGYEVFFHESCEPGNRIAVITTSEDGRAVGMWTGCVTISVTIHKEIMTLIENINMGIPFEDGPYSSEL